MFKVKIPIRVYTEEELVQLELSSDEDAQDNVPMTGVDTMIFYSIDCIKKNNYDKLETIVYSNGNAYFVPMQIEDVERLIDTQIKQFRYGFN